MKNTMRFFFQILSVVTLQQAAFSATFHVSATGSSTAPYDTWAKAATNINDAVALAGDDDTVWVTNGTYSLYTQIDISSGYQLLSINGPSNTVLDFNSINRGVVLSHSSAVLEGFSLKNIGVTANVGVLLSNGVVRGCSLDGNVDQTFPGNPINGFDYCIRVEGGLAESCTVARAGQRGVWISGGTVRHCDITGNDGYTLGSIQMYGGGGVYSEGGETVECRIYDNMCNEGSGGGGVYLTGTGVVRNCVIDQNRLTARDSNVRGSAAYCVGDGTLDACVVRDNQDYYNFGTHGEATIWCVETGRVQNCEIYGNYVTLAGGLVNIYCADDALVQNSTIVDNIGTVHSDGGVIRNSIITHNRFGNYFASITNISGNLSNFTYCLTQPAADGAGNITNQALFADANTRDYRLSQGSPGIDQGTSVGAPLYDIADGVRPLDGDGDSSAFFDIGAHEHNTNDVLPIASQLEVAPFPVTTCSNVTMVYYPNEGLLADSSNVYAVISYKQLFVDDESVAMNYNASETNWSAAFTPAGYPEFWVSFTNAIGDADQYMGLGWNYSVTNCPPPGPVSSEVLVDPSPVIGCSNITVTYYPNEGALEGSSSVFAVIDYDDGDPLPGSPLPMAYSAAGTNWSASFDLIAGTTNFTVVFSNDVGDVDHHMGTGWSFGVSDCGYILPYVFITNEVVTVEHTVVEYTLGGTNGGSVVGTMTWSNSANSANGAFSAPSGPAYSWQVSGISLAYGDNIISVFGSNEVGDTASDAITIHRNQQSTNYTLVHYVSPSGASIPPYTNWSMAATVIQDAIDVAQDGDTVLVTNGIYETGGAFAGELSCRVALTNAIILQSVNGFSNTVIAGSSTGPVRCAYVTNGASIVGFTLTNGVTRSDTVFYNEKYIMGGGAWLESEGMLSNCLVTGNLGLYGGGTHGGTLNNCTVSGNRVYEDGYGGGCRQGTLNHCVVSGNYGISQWSAGGTDGCIVNNSTISENGARFNGGNSGGTLNNCLIIGNSAYIAGGSGGGTLNNCLIIGNSAEFSGAVNGSVLNNCTVSSNSIIGAGTGAVCTGGEINNTIVYGNFNPLGPTNLDSAVVADHSCSPDLVHGVNGNVTDDPQFVDAGSEDYHLQPTSSCIDAGMMIAGILNDRDGVARPLDGDNNGTAVHDMGCYEYLHSAADSDNDGLTDGDEVSSYGTNPAKVDTDDDDFSDYQEMVADTDGADGNDYFHVETVSINSPVTIYFDSSASRLYSLIMSTNLIDGLWTNIPGFGPRAGIDGADYFQVTNDGIFNSYSVTVELP